MRVNFHYKSLLFLLFSFFLTSALVAQRVIRGKVLDAETKEPLTGASVIETGSKQGTLTDLNGNFSINVATETERLTFSYPGYTIQVIDIGVATFIEVKLKSGAFIRILDQVVVVGYATLKQKEVTSSIVTLKSEDFNKGNVNDVLTLLQGKVAGLSIAKPTGDPNENPTVRLRGISTIGSNASPLIVVDGVPGVDLALIEPNDIEQVDILRDGSAAAIYGARASSGVILITTRKGEVGPAKVAYTHQTVFNNIANRLPVMTAAQYLAANAAAGNSIADVDKGSTTDWLAEVSRPQSISQIHNLTLSGGYDKTTFHASVNYRNLQGIQLKTGYDQINTRFSLTQKALGDRLTLRLHTIGTLRNANFGFNDAFRYGVTYNPTAPVKNGLNANSNGGYTQLGGFDNFNPRAIVDQNTRVGTQKNLYIQTNAEFEIIKDLKIGGTFANIRSNALNGEYYSRVSAYRGVGRGGLALRQVGEAATNFFNATLSYKFNIKKSTLNLLLAHEYQTTQGDSLTATAGGFPTDEIGFNSIGSAAELAKAGLVNIGSTRNVTKLAGFLGRAIYTYDDDFTFMASLRREGSSMFAPKNQWGIFPSASASASLLRFIKIKGVEQLKLRVGYGLTGALPAESNLFQSTYKVTSNGQLELARNPNENIKWEQKAELNIGIDFVAANTRLTGAADVYNRQISDLLYFFPNTPTGIFEREGIWANGGSLTSRGIDLTLDYAAFVPKAIGKFAWKTGIILSTFDVRLNEIETDALRSSTDGTLHLGYVGAPGFANTTLALVRNNKPLGQLVAFIHAGNNERGEPLVQTASGETKPSYQADLATDGKVVGNGIPKFSLGWKNTLSYKGFEMDCFFRGVFGHSLVNLNRVFYENANAGSLKNYNRVASNQWDPSIKLPTLIDRYVEKADFVRLDNILIGYNFKMKAHSNISTLKLFVTGNNLFTITKYTGVDPEVRWTDSGTTDNGQREQKPDPLVQGIDRRSNYFTTRAVSVGLNLVF